MGLPMAGHLLAAGHAVTVHSRTKAKAAAILAKGAVWAETPREAAEGAEVVFVCVTDTPDVRAVLTGAGGVVEATRPGLIVVDHSTISPTATREMAAELARKQTVLLDAPVSGGDVGARNGTLSIMVGGPAEEFAKVEPLLRHMGKTITHCGPSGTGQLTKLVNQILVSVTNLAVSEALVFAKNNGLDAEKTVTALSGGAAGSWQLQNLGPRMLKGDFAPGFTIDLQQKDLRLVIEAAAQAKTPLPALALVHQLFTSAQAAGRGRDGTQALFTVIEKLSK
ncbi:MAG: garR [Phycisphaerales bacterium]|nr:garR [Phycisphaerales bacterium]